MPTLSSTHIILSSVLCSRSQLMGTFQYRAPELLRGFLPSFKADIYSFGITGEIVFHFFLLIGLYGGAKCTEYNIN